jgi:hypothetical protein
MKAPSLVVATAALAIVWAPSPCRAQSAAKRATPASNPLHALTQALAGKWKLDVRFEATPSTGNKVIAGPGEESWSAGPGGITLIEEEHIPSAYGDTFLMGVIWWDSTRNHLGGMECNSYLPVTCDLKGGLNDITISWDGRKFQIDDWRRTTAATRCGMNTGQTSRLTPLLRRAMSPNRTARRCAS